MSRLAEKICMQPASRISKDYSLLGAEVNYLVYGGSDRGHCLDCNSDLPVVYFV